MLIIFLTIKYVEISHPHTKALSCLYFWRHTNCIFHSLTQFWHCLSGDNIRPAMVWLWMSPFNSNVWTLGYASVMCLTEGTESLGRPALRFFIIQPTSCSLPLSPSLSFHSISSLSFLTSNVTWSSVLTTVISQPWGSVSSNCQSNINSYVVWMWDGLCGRAHCLSSWPSGGACLEVGHWGWGLNFIA